MLYSVGCEYGIRALSKLATEAKAGEYRLLQEIVDGIDVPRHFLGKVFQSLVRANVLKSAKGRGGGYALAWPPEEIRLREIVEAIDGVARTSRCVLGLAECDESQPCPQHDQWTPIKKQIDDLLDNTTLADLAEALLKKSRPRRKRQRRR